MASQDEARRYLEEALAAAGTDMATASRAVARNHAYLQQYIRKGKPRWLPEQIRDGLAQLYQLDAERLRPPPAKLQPAGTNKRAVRNGNDKAQVHAPGYGQFVDDPRTLELLGIWGAMSAERRELALRILRNLADDASVAI